MSAFELQGTRKTWDKVGERNECSPKLAAILLRAKKLRLRSAEGTRLRETALLKSTITRTHSVDHCSGLLSSCSTYRMSVFCSPAPPQVLE